MSPIKPSIELILLKNTPIFDQLRIEEALLRTDNRNFCLINIGTEEAIVMGISGKPEHLIDSAIFNQNPVPVIKRFSGGGTVFVDANTVFVTWIFQTEEIKVSCCPIKIHQWGETFYRAALPSIDIKLKENDYVIGEKKWGGNAQYLCKGRWLHHTSILWNFNLSAMSRLLIPKKMPTYRNSRPHDDFLCCLSDYLPNKEFLVGNILNTVDEMFNVNHFSFEAAKEITHRPHRITTCLI